MPKQPKALAPGELSVLVRFTVIVAVVLCLKLGVTMGKRPTESEHSKDPITNRPTRGRTIGPGFTIDWSGIGNPDAADPVDVLKAIKGRMQYLQATAYGSDKNAKALWEVNKAIAILEDSVVEDVGAVGGTLGATDGGGAGFQAPKGGN